MKNLYYFLFLMFVLASCKETRVSEFENAESISLSDFSTKKLHGEVIDLDPIWNPIGLRVEDSLLFLVNRSGKTYCQVFNLNNHTVLSDNLPSGSGPNEFTSFPQLQIDRINNSIMAYCGQMRTIREYKFDDFINNSNINPIGSVFFEAAALSVEKIPGKKYIGTFIHRFDSMFEISDSTGHLTETTMPFPNVVGFDADDLSKKFAYGNGIGYSQAQNKFVQIYSFVDVIDVLDTNFNLLRRVHGPYHTIPTADETKKMTTFDATSICSKYIYALYSGHLVGDNSAGYTNIFVFDYNLNPIVKYELDIPIFNLAVDEESKIMYGLADYPERCVVKFNF